MLDSRRTHSLPSVNAVLDYPGVRILLGSAPRDLVVRSVRLVIDQVRNSLVPVPDSESNWSALITTELRSQNQKTLIPVLNATGVVLHTNLGRSPLPRAALDAIAQTAGEASNLEYELSSGSRGSRYVHCASLLAELTGAEDALVVNNGAAALILALNTLALGKEAIVSRGELIEIGGSFRIPDIMGTSGAKLREIGTTNRTHLEDYRRALNPGTGALLKIHQSNFEQRGFVAEADLRSLAGLAAEAGVPLIHDLGSGLLVSLERWGLRGEPLASASPRDGADIVVMSGDKLLGGPQAGIMLGKASAIQACRNNPLARALRVDKLTLAALEATLRLYRDPEVALREIPVLAMLTAAPESILERAHRLATELLSRGIRTAVGESTATVGGGAFPSAAIPSFALTFRDRPVQLDQALRSVELPVVGRIVRDELLLDLRTVPPEHDMDLVESIVVAFAKASSSQAAS